MIPKRLIFIQLGPEFPNYGNFCIDNFRQVNQDFEILFVNEPDLNNIKNEDLIECKKLVESDTYNIYKHMTVRPFAKNNFFGQKGKIVALADAFRLYLLNKYGGIYLDLDTFPVKKFDDKLLSYENGFAVNHIKNRCDYFFLGFNKNCVDSGLIRYIKEYDYGQIFNNQVHKLKYEEKYLEAFKNKVNKLKNKFINKELIFGDSIFNKYIFKEYYIDHFRIGSWKNE